MAATPRRWPVHTLQPNLLTTFFLKPWRDELPPSVLSELYVEVPAAPVKPKSTAKPAAPAKPDTATTTAPTVPAGPL